MPTRPNPQGLTTGKQDNSKDRKLPNKGSVQVSDFALVFTLQPTIKTKF
jgi:hypothetical protein